MAAMTPCWEWTHSLTHEGYPQDQRGGRKVLVHRAVFEMAYGWVPEEVHHECENRCCVNPEHLVGLTHVEHGKLHHPLTDVCHRGHPRTPENTRLDERGKRRCKTCDRDKSRRYVVRRG